MSSTRKKFPVRRHPVVVDIGCGCRRPKLSSLFSPSSLPTPKTRNPSSPTATTSASMSHTATSTTTTTSYPSSPSQSNSETERPARKTRTKSVVDESEPVVKESSDPYHDFRDSMLHMIMEKEISSWDDLRTLLHRFLALNSAHHHHLILRAWNSLFEQFSTSVIKAAVGSEMVTESRS